MSQSDHTFRLTPRKVPTQDRARATVDAIVEATARVLVAEGYAAINTNRIAEIAGVSVGSLYQYFPTKESLVGELYRSRRIDLADVLVNRLMQLADSSAEDVGSSLAEVMIHYYRADGALNRLLLRRAARLGARRKVADVEAGVLEAIATFLQSNANLRADDPKTQAVVLWTTIDAIAQEVLFFDESTPLDPTKAELALLITRFLARG